MEKEDKLNTSLKTVPDEGVMIILEHMAGNAGMHRQLLLNLTKAGKRQKRHYQSSLSALVEFDKSWEMFI